MVMPLLAGLLIVLGTGQVSAQKVKETEKDKSPRKFKSPLPDEVVNAWVKASAYPCWLGVDSKSGSPALGSDIDSKFNRLDKATAVPAFRFIKWKDVPVTKLPIPGKPFGLSLSGFEVTDDSLRDLPKLKDLVHIAIDNSEVTEAGLKHLAGVKSLVRLEFGVEMSDMGLKYLADIKGLTHLSIKGNQVTNAGLKEFAVLKDLVYLDLGFSKVTGEGMKELAKMKGIKGLALRGMKETDEGLKELCALKNLTSINLVGTDVTDGGLKHLAGMKNLTFVYLDPRKVSKDAVEQLRKALPKCYIVSR